MHFGSISGYKLNANKSELLAINSKARRISFETFQFKVKTDHMTYLGIKVTNLYRKLFEENVTPLLERNKNDFQRWGNLPLSLIGRINVVKMNTLPTFLYLFQCIPTCIPKMCFYTLDKCISAFICNNKTARIRKDFLQRKKQSGGLALPNFQLYYWAANVRNMLNCSFYRDTSLASY